MKKLKFSQYNLDIGDKNLVGLNNEFNSDKEFTAHVKSQIEKEIQIRQVKNDGKNVPIESVDIVDFIMDIYKPKYMTDIINEEKEITLYLRNYDTKLPIYKPLDIERVIIFIAETKGIKGLKDIAKATKDVTRRIKKSSDFKLESIKELKLPPAHIILMNNGVLNLKTMEFSKNINEFGKFDFLNILSFNMPTEQSVNKLYLEIVKRIFNDWSDNKDDHLLYLKQLCFAALEGNGRKMYHILKAGGGNGKSTFLTILENLAGKKYTTNLELHKIMDDNSINKINLSNKLIVGHDLSTNAKLSSDGISRFKLLTTGEPFQVNVKYKDNTLIQSYGLKIQSTNSDISVFENTTAIKRRLCIFSWTESDFTKSKLEDNMNLSDLVDNLHISKGNITEIDIENQKKSIMFYEALIYFILNNMEYFDTFSVPQSAIDNTDDIVNEADNVYQFLNYMKDNELMIGKMLTTHLYKLYKCWLQVENSGSKPLNNRAFINRFKNLTDKFGILFEINDNSELVSRKATFKELECDLNYYNELYQGKLNLLRKDKSNSIEFKDQITDEDIDKFKQALEEDINQFSLEDLSYKEMLMRNYLIKQGYREAALIS